MIPEFAIVKKYFESHHITLNEEWLQSCIEWYKEENPGSNCVKELQNRVYEQWLNSDFRELQLNLLPNNVSNQKRIVLYKSMCLQLMYVVDISKPKLHQLMTIRKPKSYSQHSTETTSAKRVLELVLTDGTQEVSAIECHVIPFLNIDLSPGLKVRLNAPITIRMGQIVLEQSSIQLLGGEVDDLLVSNAAENILAARLGLALNPTPNAMEGFFTQKENDTSSNQTATNSINNQNSYRVEASRPQNPGTVNTRLRNEESQVQPYNNRTNNPRNSNVPRAKTPDMFDDDFDVKDFETIDKIVDQNVPKPEVLIDDMDEFEELMRASEVEHQPKVRKIEENTSASSMLPVRKPIKTISTLNKMKVNSGKFIINAKFNKIVEKLSISEQGYSIKITVEDSTGLLDAAVHTDMIATLCGYDHKALFAMKDSMSQDRSIAKTIYKCIDGLKSKLMSLDGDIQVLVEAKKECPTILRMV